MSDQRSLVRVSDGAVLNKYDADDNFVAAVWISEEQYRQFVPRLLSQGCTLVDSNGYDLPADHPAVLKYARSQGHFRKTGNWQTDLRLLGEDRLRTHYFDQIDGRLKDFRKDATIADVLLLDKLLSLWESNVLNRNQPGAELAGAMAYLFDLESEGASNADCQ